MASSTPSAPITSSRGAADTTAGRIYLSTPSAQVRVPVGDLVFPPPLMLTLYYLGKNIRERQRKGAAGEREAGGGKIIPRRRKNYPAAE